MIKSIGKIAHDEIKCILLLTIFLTNMYIGVILLFKKVNNGENIV